MPPLVGLNVEQAEQALSDASLKIRYEYAKSADEERDTLSNRVSLRGQSSQNSRKSPSRLGKAAGKVDLTKLELNTMTGDEAKLVLESHNLKVELQEETSEETEKGRVLRFEPEKAEPGSSVKVFVSSGPAVPMVPMIDITGMSEGGRRDGS